MNPAHNLPFPSPLSVNDTPLIVSGGSGTSFPNMKFNSLIESFVLSVVLILNAPLLNPADGVPITKSPLYVAIPETAVTIPESTFRLLIVVKPATFNFPVLNRLLVALNAKSASVAALVIVPDVKLVTTNL